MVARAIHCCIAALGLIVLPLVAGAQPADKVARIGYLGTNIGPASLPPIEAFRAGLRELGWIDGRNIVVEYRWGRGRADEVAAANAAELGRLGLDLIVAAASVYVGPVREATNTTPIVFCVSSDPVGAGFVSSLARPGGRITGLSSLETELAAKSLELLTRAMPGARKIAVLGDLADPTSRLAVAAIEAIARPLGVELLVLHARNIEEAEAAFVRMTAVGSEALVGLVTSVFYSNRVRLSELTLEHRLPSVWAFSGFAAAGSLLSYGPNLNEMFRRCAAYVDKILKGADPAELPVEQAPKYDLVINLKTAHALGLTIPPEILARADEVIE